ncbi:hypothetical protein [Luteibacter sp.]|uniref:hypothetical protein n=1 Tax=Luteibacter sp. TaxID=1886636 RepID=UPI003F7D6AA7
MIGGVGSSVLPSVMSSPANVSRPAKGGETASDPVSAVEYTLDDSWYASTGTDYHTTNAWHLGTTLEAFGKRLDLVTSRMRTIRPDIADAPYDLKLDQGRLVVVGDALDERSRIWLEESVNGDRELVRLAKDFNELAVEVLDPKGKNAFNTKGRHYDKLDMTIDRSTRFVSLLKQVESTSPASSWGWMPFQHAAGLVEEQVMADTYEYQAKGGTIELLRRMDTPSFYARF